MNTPFAGPLDNRAFRFGDGIFETIRIVAGEIPLWPYHWQRLQHGAAATGIGLPKGTTEASLLKAITVNQLKARARITLYRIGKGLYAPDAGAKPAIAVETRPFGSDEIEPLEKVDVCPDIILACDTWANIKSCSSMRYVAAARFRQAQGLDDCFLLNSHGRVAEASSSNLFAVFNQTLITPPLTEGCVAGVMRAYLLDNAEAIGFEVKTAPLTLEQLAEADEIFLTNAIHGCRTVARFGQRSYDSSVCLRLREHLPF